MGPYSLEAISKIVDKGSGFRVQDSEVLKKAVRTTLNPEPLNVEPLNPQVLRLDFLVPPELIRS
jgi:hypothetical protein